MANKIKDEMARILAKWLFKDFGLLIDEPAENEIAKTLEEYGQKE